MLFKEFFMRVFTRSRKLAPIRVKPSPINIEKADKIKVNIHIVKGYNIPIRINSPVQASIDERKLFAVTHNSIYRNIFNQDDRRQEIFRNSFGMQNNILNNSGPFSNNLHSNNESFSIGMVFTGVRSMGFGSPISMEFSMRASRPIMKYLKPLMFLMFLTNEFMEPSLLVSCT